MLLSALLLPALLAALAGAVPARSPPPPPPGQSAADGALPADILCSAFGGGPHCKGSPEPAPATPGRGRRQAEAATADLCALFGGPDCPTEAPVTGIECDCPDKSGDRCECVSFYHCNSTGADNVDGVGLHDGCPLYEHVCCKIDIPKDKRETPEPHKGPGRGRRQAQAATADEQQQQCAIFGGAACGPARDKRQEQAEQGAEIDPEQLCGIFAGPTCTSEQQNKVYDPCTCPAGSGDGCECVPYYNCDGETGNYNTDGIGVIDIRQKQDREGYDASAPNSTCPHYLQQCCRVRQGQGPTPGPDPGPDPGPAPGPDPGPVTDEPWTQPQRPPPGPGPQPLKKPKCGVRQKNGVGDRISGALHDETNYGEITWMVAIFKKRQAEHDYVCGGGLIAPNVVMTAAHCVNEKTPSNLKIRAGEWDSRTTLERYPHQDRDVAEIITHPDYKPQALHNDVALLVLREPVRLSVHIGTVCLPDQGQNFDHRTCLVSGWGKDVFGKEGVYQNIMRRIDDLPVVPYAQCQEKLRRTRVGPYFRLNKSFMCAGGVKGRDACTGDGGSPLACPITDSEDTRYKFAGIVSWGVGCGEEDVPGVYADVAQFRSWIDDQLATRGITLPRADDGDD